MDWPSVILIALFSAAAASVATLVLGRLAIRRAERTEIDDELDSRTRLAASQLTLRATQIETQRLRHALTELQVSESFAQIAAGVAHATVDRLAAILGNAELARHGSATRQNVDEEFDAIISAAQGGAEDLSRLVRYGRPVNERITFDLHHLLADAARLIALGSGGETKLELELDAPRSVLVGEPTKLILAVIDVAVALSRDERDGVLSLRTYTIEASSHRAVPTAADGPAVILQLAVRGGERGDDSEPRPVGQPSRRNLRAPFAALIRWAEQHGASVSVSASPPQGSSHGSSHGGAAGAQVSIRCPVAAAEAGDPDRYLSDGSFEAILCDGRLAHLAASPPGMTGPRTTTLH